MHQAGVKPTINAKKTSNTHVSNILRKLGLASRTQAALWAVREGLGPDEREEASA